MLDSLGTDRINWPLSMASRWILTSRKRRLRTGLLRILMNSSEMNVCCVDDLLHVRKIINDRDPNYNSLPHLSHLSQHYNVILYNLKTARYSGFIFHYLINI